MSNSNNKKVHREWRKENTLTSPSDRDLNNKFRLDSEVPTLTNEQTSEAMSKLNDNSFTVKFPEVERRYADPSLDLQKIGLVSFVPAKGATPNEQGIYGFAKLRGNFATEVEANERAEYLIKNVDSYHQIYHTYVGRPFPLTCSSDYSKEVNRVDLQKQVSATMSEDIRQKREKEQKDIEEIKEKEKTLLEDVKNGTDANRDDCYTTLKVKKAQLTWTFVETKKKLEQMKGLIVKARREIEDLDEKYPELKDNYFNKYMEARKQAGLTTDKVEASESFIKYMVEDYHIPEVEEEYIRLYRSNHWDY